MCKNNLLNASVDKQATNENQLRNCEHGQGESALDELGKLSDLLTELSTRCLKARLATLMN